MAHEVQPSVSLMFLPHFDVLCDLLLNRRTATWNLFVLYSKDLKKSFNDDLIYTSVLQQIMSENQSKCVHNWAYYNYNLKQNTVYNKSQKTSVTHSAMPCVLFLCSYHILASSIFWHWTETQQHGINLSNGPGQLKQAKKLSH